MQDNSIPLLTEVIEVASAPPASGASPAQRPPPVHAGAANVAANVASNVAAKTAGSGTAPDAMALGQLDLEQLQNKLTERVLRQLQGRIDFVLEQRIRDSLADVLQLAMIGLTNDIKRGLQHTLEEVIGRAVAQELAKLHNIKK
jgi:hypothetical protein